MGDKLRVKVIKCDIDAHKIEFMLADKQPDNVVMKSPAVRKFTFKEDRVKGEGGRGAKPQKPTGNRGGRSTAKSDGGNRTFNKPQTGAGKVKSGSAYGKSKKPYGKPAGEPKAVKNKSAGGAPKKAGGFDKSRKSGYKRGDKR